MTAHGKAWMARRKPQPAHPLDDIWADATNAVCQTMQDRSMCKCPDGGCLAAKVLPEPADYAYHDRKPAPTAAQQIAAAFERRRQPVPLGTYGRIDVIDHVGRGICLDINNPNVAFSADDCREAAHLLNQIAETLESHAAR